MESLPHLRDMFPEHFKNNSPPRPTPTNNVPLSRSNTLPHYSQNPNMPTTGDVPIGHSATNTTPKQYPPSRGAPGSTASTFSVLHSDTTSGALEVVSTSYSLPTNSSWAAMQRAPSSASSSSPNIPLQGTSSDRRKHVCPTCSKPFERISSLQTHMHIHTGERPYTCPIKECGREFNAKSNMLRHYRGHFSR